MAESFHIDNVTLADLPEGGFRAALRFWLDAKGDRQLPPASAIDPLKLPRDILSSLIVTSVEPGPKRLRVRLVGTAVVNAAGHDFTGQYSEDFDRAENSVARLYAAIEKKKPYYYGGPLVWASNDFQTYRSLIMPFGNEAGEVTRLVGYIQFT